MSTYKVSAESLTTVAGELSTGAGSISEQLVALKAKVDGLGSEWEGSGNAAFNDLYLQWNDAGYRLQEALLGISAQLTKTAAGYDEAERNATNAASYGH